ncbi:MCBG protein [Labilithrix luteola]|uniref:MCBG protein n=1 Tax=Labilithrix luteola TaxID=1391654 RepID=A0A0K1PMD4_9BACT|nr:pentapeptide repeat-containing protein [Labilithrix luteola]AKU94698.1 MCBG protein [Labilithrix luteola]
MPVANPFEGKTSFEEQTFEGLALEREDLGGREFYGCTFRNSKLAETRWLRTRLEECTFEGCDLSGADFTMLSLREVTFLSCRLMGIDFSKVGQFPNVSFEDCNLRYVSMVSIPLRKTTFRRCAIKEASFFEADLVEAKFEECQFAETRFESCDLRKAKFPNAQDLFLDPARNRLKDTHVPLETAILLARSFGMRVLGFSDSRDD